MLIELNKDPLFQVTESPIKAIKEKELLRKKEIRERRINPRAEKRQVDIQIVDPLPQQLNQHRDKTTVRMSVETSKASQSLKKYVIEQQRNLRCLRLDKIETDDDKIATSRLKSLTLNVTQMDDDERSSKEINIPRIEDIFKNQSKEIMVYENTTLRDRLGKMVNSLDGSINRFKHLSFSYTQPIDPSSLATTHHSKHTRHHHLRPTQQGQDYQKSTENRLTKSKDLRERLYREKREMVGRAPGQSSKSNPSGNMSFFLREIEKPKRRQSLRGVRTYSYEDGGKMLKLTSASILLFQMNKLNQEKQKKEYQLSGLLKNSFQNRDSILSEKESFYASENPFNELSPSKQFQLRKVMNKKLNRRLQISKEQVNKFNSYLLEIRNYHVILNSTILDILREVREALLKGKVMKLSDLEDIVETKCPQDLRGYPNELIIKTLTQMMI